VTGPRNRDFLIWDPLDSKSDPEDPFSENHAFGDVRPDVGLKAALDAIERHSSILFTPMPSIDVRRLRERLRLTQRRFCRLFGFPLATLKHWERRDRKPSGTALVLLHLIQAEPQAVIQGLRKARLKLSERG
jgi:DNA-binding transcriptional regulator YiaG